MGCGGEYGLIEFGNQDTGYRSAAHLARKFDRARHGRCRWNLVLEKKGSYFGLAKRSYLRLFGRSQVYFVNFDRAWKSRMLEEYFNDKADTYALIEEAIATRS